MKTNALSIADSLMLCQELEKRAHVTLDDVLNKAVQEVAEMLEASVAGDAEETRKEAGDALTNVLSASSAALWGADVGISSLAPVLGRDRRSSRNANNPQAFKAEDVYARRTPPRPAESLERNSDILPESAASLFLKLGAWNSKIQSLRGRYSRSKASADEVRQATGDLVEAILSFVPDCAPEKLVADTVAKFAGRVDAYKSEIDLRDFVAEYADFPKPGILFKDVSPMLASPEAMRVAAHEIALRCDRADVIVGLDARGFLFGMAAAKVSGKPFVMVRKKGKLPGETISKEYGLEYGKDVIEIQKYANIAGKKVAIVDDLLATGGTAMAAAELVEKAGGVVDSVVFAVSLDSSDLASMPKRAELAKYRVESLLSYE